MAGSVGRLVSDGALLVVFPSVHYNLAFRMVAASEVAVLDVANASKLVRYVLIRDLCARKTACLSWLNLTWMDRGRRHPRIHYWLSVSRHSSMGYSMDRCGVSSCSYLNLRVIYNEVVYIIVRYDIGYYLLVFLTSRGWPLTFLSLLFVVCRSCS